MTVRLDTTAIKKAMAEKRMTTAALARLMGCKPQNVGLMINRGTCSHINAALIADALGVEIEEIWKEGA